MLSQMATKQIHGFIGSALIGIDPFDPRSWSGISRFFFQECQRQGILHGASGGEVKGVTRLLLLAMSAHPNREIWRLRYYLRREYRNALTRVLAPAVRSLPADVDAIQIGALFDIPSLTRGSRRCFSYHDGNLAMRLHNPFAATAIPPRLAAAAMDYERTLYHKLDRVFTMSEHLRQSFINDFGLPAERVVCIGAGVNLDTLPPDRSDKAYDTKQILFVGVDFMRKGGAILLQAFQRLREVHPEAILNIVGPKSPPPADLPMGGVVWHGMLNKQIPMEAAKLDHLFASCSFFVLPSLYEPFGIAPAEAMMHSMPAIVTGAWALGETVTDGITGLHTAPGDVKSLAAAMQRLFDDPVLCRRLGQTARQSAITQFTWEGVVKRLIRTISEDSA